MNLSTREAIAACPIVWRDDEVFAWCYQCQRVYELADWQRHDWCCPAWDLDFPEDPPEGCDGSLLDMQPWRTCFARQAFSAHPVIPVAGRAYSMYRSPE